MFAHFFETHSVNHANFVKAFLKSLHDEPRLPLFDHPMIELPSSMTYEQVFAEFDEIIKTLRLREAPRELEDIPEFKAFVFSHASVGGMTIGMTSRLFLRYTRKSPSTVMIECFGFNSLMRIRQRSARSGARSA